LPVFDATATFAIYTLSLHDALPIFPASSAQQQRFGLAAGTQLFHSLIVHYDNGIPIQLEDRVVDASVAPDYLKQNWEQMTPNERSEEHTSELQSRENLVCRLLLEKK